jgi:hypothetical protein
MRYINKNIGLFLAVSSILFAGCVTPMGMTSSSSPLKAEKMENLGVVEGRAMTGSVLGVWSVGKPDIDLAIKRALRKKRADVLINVRWYEQTYYFILFSLHEVIVTGDAVRYVHQDEVYCYPDKNGERK